MGFRKSADDRPQERHLEVLRRLLAQDHIARARWSVALRDAASMVREALGATAALVALHDPASGSWSAVSSDGAELFDTEISSRGSRTVLDEVRQTGSPILTSSRKGDRSSRSAHFLAIEHVMAVPLFFWDVAAERPERRFGGCFYVHRSAPARPFSEADAELLLDVARLAQPTLNVLLHLHKVEARLLESEKRLAEVERLSSQLGDVTTLDPVLGRTLATLGRAATAGKVNVLILGPTGTGKSHLAQAFHGVSTRRAKPFVVLDGGQATSAETLAAELFGYAPSSGYANAPPKGRPGKAQLADGGTLFLDEVATLTPELQQRLLRLVQHGKLTPLGGSTEATVDLQIVAASNESLRRLVKQGRFREDLFWRLAEIVVQLPGLSERPADVLPFAERFLSEARQRYGRSDAEGLDAGARDALLRHDWSSAGNVRGLQQTVSRAVLLAPQGTRFLGAEHLLLETLDESRPADEPVATPVATRGLEGLLIRKIRETAGTVATMASDPEVAAACGHAAAMPDSSLTQVIRDLGLMPVLEAERGRRRAEAGDDLAAIRGAVRAHGSGTAAARALGITRDALVWRLRKAGLTIEDLLGHAE